MTEDSIEVSAVPGQIRKSCSEFTHVTCPYAEKWEPPMTFLQD